MEIAFADAVFDDYAALTSGRVFEADDDHAVASETSPPPLVAVFGADTPGGDELEVAGRANVRGMLSHCRQWNRVEDGWMGYLQREQVDEKARGL
ncbi:MAG: hypothetical protein FRX48_03668 [Lasallia pustulata]|uniref:Uncharacterized protein n=1 Tax=Lasallia pustulata TaxID=136370 RepID=A0A5M8PSW9_9LECA|nr:MAG: hypothetical protein FRX48_03668 [Lasallia pustulata]